MMNWANVLRAQCQWEEARKLIEQTLELDRQIGPPDSPARASLLGDLARVLKALGRDAEAHKRFEEALQLSRRVNGPKHPDTMLTASNFAWFLATTPNPQLRDPARAVALAKEAVQCLPKDEYNWNILGAASYAA